MAKDKSILSCPKCGSSAVSGSKVNMPHVAKTHVKYKCLNCGNMFDQIKIDYDGV